MRKTSQDGGDSTSITSGFENEVKKGGVGLIRTKRNSIKKKVQNFSHESDDTVNEPLLQMEKIDSANRSAKFLLSKSKADSVSDRENSIHSDKSSDKGSMTKTVSPVGAAIKNSFISGTLHNHMNTNVFGGHDGTKTMIPVKSPLLVEINASKSTSYSPAPLIFTTARIHTDSKTKNMEPVHVTPVPILSTIEGISVKAGVINLYGQTSTPATLSSANVLKEGKTQFSCVQHTDTGICKSDSYKPNTQNMASKFGDASERPSMVSSVEFEPKCFKKSLDNKNISVTSGSIPENSDNEKSSKEMSLSEETRTTSEIEKSNTDLHMSRSIAESGHVPGKKTDLKQNLGSGNTLYLQKTVPCIPDQSTSKPLQEIIIGENTHKIIHTGSGNSKHLLRQKNYVDDPKESDAEGKKVYESLVNKDLSNNSLQTSKSQLQSTVHTCTGHSKNRNTSITTSSNTNSIKILNKSLIEKRNTMSDALTKQCCTDSKIKQQLGAPKSETLTESRSTTALVSKSLLEKPLSTTENVTQKQNVSSVPNSVVKSANGSVTIETTQSLKTGVAPKKIPVTTAVTRSIPDSQNVKSSSLDKSCKPSTLAKLETSEISVPSTSSSSTKIDKTSHVAISSKSAKSESTTPVIQSNTSNTKAQSSVKASSSSISAIPNVKSSTSEKPASIASKQMSSKGKLSKDGNI